MSIRLTAVVGALMLSVPAVASAQDRGWVADASIGYAGFVDDATKHYLLAGAGVRRHVTPRVSIGPEVVIMSNGSELRDRNVMLTGNVVLDVFGQSSAGMRRVSPFLVGGLGMFWGRDQVRGGPFWSRDPAFTAGAG